MSAVLFYRVLIQDQMVLGLRYSDTMELFFYFRSFGFGCLKQRILPLWNPYVFSGYPFLANMGSALFYPLNALYFFLTVPAAMNWSVAVHITLAAVAMYSFLRYIKLAPLAALGGGCIFAFNGTTAGWLLGGYLTCVNGFIWIPLIFLGAEIGIRDQKAGGWIGAGFALALQILAGYPQFPWIVTVGIGVYTILRITITIRPGARLRHLRKAVTGLFIMCIVASGLSAVQLLPGIECVFHSARGGIRLKEFSLMYAYPLENMVSWFIPHFFGDAWNKLPYWGRWFFWEALPFIGITSLCLIGLGRMLHRRRRETLLFLCMTVIFLLLSFGDQIPVFRWLYYAIPFAGLFRGPGRFLVIVNFAGACLAGFGLDALIRYTDDSIQEERFRRFTWVLAMFAAACALFFFLYLGPARLASSWIHYVAGALKEPHHFLRMPPESMPAFLEQSFLVMRSGFRRMLFWLTATTGVLFCFGIKPLRHAVPVVLCLLVMLELGVFFYGGMAAWNIKDIEWPEELVAFLRKETKGGYRISFYPHGGRGGLNRNILYRLSAASGFDSNILRRYNRVIARSQALPEKDRTYFTMGLCRYGRLLDLLALKSMVFYDEEVTGEGIDRTPVFTTGEFAVYRNENALPRVSLATDALVMDSEDILNSLTDQIEAKTHKVLLETAFTPPDPENPAFQNVDERTVRSEQKRRPPPLDRGLTGFAAAGTSHHGAEPDDNTLVTVLSFSEEDPNRVDMDLDVRREGFLVFRDMYYPGWKATVDGAPVEVRRADYLFRTIRVPAGRHRVIFFYAPLSVRIGMAFSLGSLICLCLYWLRLRRHPSGGGQML